MKYLKNKKQVLVSICSLFLTLGLSGCLFESFMDTGLDLHEEYPTILIADENYLYKAAFSNPGSGNKTRIERTDIKNGQSEILIGSEEIGFVNGTGTSVRFENISAMVKVPNSNLIYIGDKCTIRKLDIALLSVNVVAGSSTNCVAQNGIGTSAYFSTIKGLVVKDNFLFIADNTALRKMNLTSLEVTTIAGSLSASGDTNDTGTNARFGLIGDLALIQDDIYLLDLTYSKIKKVSLATSLVTTFIGSGTWASKDGVGLDAQVYFNTSRMSSDGVNFLFFTEDVAIRKVDISKQEVTTIVKFDDAREDIDGSISTAKSFFPSGIVYTNEGLFFSNYSGIRRLR
tara:strand:- start:854 stop:1882 length:1029 start_codon:yes stop_codon:yes gene_type:complete